MSPDSVAIEVGQTQTFAAKALNATGGEITGRTVEWSSNSAGIATVDASGTVTGTGAGTVRITATVDGVSASASARIRLQKPAAVTVSPESTTVFIGQTTTLTAEALDDSGAELSGRTVEWSSSDSAVATVTAEGVATGWAAGAVVITATIDSVSAQAVFRVEENPVKSTSYENFKAVGVRPLAIPLPATAGWGYHELARGYGDFFGRGTMDLFTATVDYDLADSPETAQRAVYRFWRRDGDSYVEDNSIMTMGTEPCLHSRKGLVADFNLDGKPDIFIACTGYDGDPFPGEPNQILLSQAGGGYLLQQAAPDAGFWHGASAADLTGDGYPDVVAVAGSERAVFVNDGTGTFTRETTNRLPGDAQWGFGGSIYFTAELVDVNEDGEVDLVMGGHEWDEGYGTTPTGIWLNPGNNFFSNVTPTVIPAVQNEGVVLDFAITGTGPTRTIWVSRSSGGDGTFYESAVLQSFDWTTGAASVVINERPAHWVPWIIPYVRDGVAYVGSDDPRTPMEYRVP